MPRSAGARLNIATACLQVFTRAATVREWAPTAFFSILPTLNQFGSGVADAVDNSDPSGNQVAISYALRTFLTA
jgi:hypothetical protein